MSNIQPVLLGADLNCYHVARAFHEAYGVRSKAFGRYPIGVTQYTRIIDFTTVPDMDNPSRSVNGFSARPPWRHTRRQCGYIITQTG